MAKYYGTIRFGDFNITDDAAKFVDFYNKECFTDISSYTKYIGDGNWNYLHRIKTNVVYAIAKECKNVSHCVFGNLDHLLSTYKLIDNKNYLESKSIIANDLYKEDNISRPECLRHEVDLLLGEDSGPIKILKY